MIIREATEQDFAGIWPIFQEIVRAGETYAYPRDTNQDEARQLWLHAPRQTFVVEEDGRILATYYIKTNQAGPGSHVLQLWLHGRRLSAGSGTGYRDV